MNIDGTGLDRIYAPFTSKFIYSIKRAWLQITQKPFWETEKLSPLQVEPRALLGTNCWDQQPEDSNSEQAVLHTPCLHCPRKPTPMHSVAKTARERERETPRLVLCSSVGVSRGDPPTAWGTKCRFPLNKDQNVSSIRVCFETVDPQHGGFPIDLPL